MKATARLLLSATTAFGLTAFTITSVFTATSTSVAAASFGLLVVYGLVEMTILSYAPRPVLARRMAPRLTVPPAVTASASVAVEFPSCTAHARAA